MMPCRWVIVPGTKVLWLGAPTCRPQSVGEEGASQKRLRPPAACILTAESAKHASAG
jgi:hypothetical protein